MRVIRFGYDTPTGFAEVTVRDTYKSHNHNYLDKFANIEDKNLQPLSKTSEEKYAEEENKRFRELNLPPADRMRCQFQLRQHVAIHNSQCALCKISLCVHAY